MGAQPKPSRSNHLRVHPVWARRGLAVDLANARAMARHRMDNAGTRPSVLLDDQEGVVGAQLHGPAIGVHLAEVSRRPSDRRDVPVHSQYVVSGRSPSGLR